MPEKCSSSLNGATFSSKWPLTTCTCSSNATCSLILNSNWDNSTSDCSRKKSIVSKSCKTGWARPTIKSLASTTCNGPVGLTPISTSSDKDKCPKPPRKYLFLPTRKPWSLWDSWCIARTWKATSWIRTVTNFKPRSLTWKPTCVMEVMWCSRMLTEPTWSDIPNTSFVKRSLENPFKLENAEENSEN